MFGFGFGGPFGGIPGFGGMPVQGIGGPYGGPNPWGMGALNRFAAGGGGGPVDFGAMSLAAQYAPAASAGPPGLTSLFGPGAPAPAPAPAPVPDRSAVMPPVASGPAPMPGGVFNPRMRVPDAVTMPGGPAVGNPLAPANPGVMSPIGRGQPGMDGAGNFGSPGMGGGLPYMPGTRPGYFR